MTREKWLQEAVSALHSLFRESGVDQDVPDVHVSCGFPSVRGTSTSKRRIGECWKRAASEDERNHIFISPLLADPVEVLATLAHELIHAIDNGENGHKGPFRRMAVAIGLTGKMTATHAGDELAGRLNALSLELGDYPHGALKPGARAVKKQGTRNLKAECPECGYTIRVTRKWLDVGLPTCVCGTEMEESSE